MEEIEEEMTVKEYYTSKVGIKSTTPVKVEKIENVLGGEDLEKCLKFMRNVCTPHNCHCNAAMAWVILKGWKVSFCEGLGTNFLIPHCWTCLTNKETGEKRYVDFTLNEECESILFMEWEQQDIINLFSACNYAFIPFDSWEFNLTKKGQKIMLKYYPNLKGRMREMGNVKKNGYINIVTR